MPFDGYVARALKCELNAVLKESRIDKIYQPDKFQLVLRFKRGRETRKLLISVNSSLPYIAMTEMDKTNPSSPPLFCMVLRKHLQGGFLSEVVQYDNDRILFFDFHTHDEMKFSERKRLVVELMGKHSNIILVDSEGIIIDSIRRIPSTISRQRQVLPGLAYDFPPDQDKINIEECICSDFYEKIQFGNTDVYKMIYSNYKGISPILAKEFCQRSGIDPHSNTADMDSASSKKLWETIISFGKSIDSGNEKPTVFTEKNSPKDFHATELETYPNQIYERENFNSISCAIDRFYIDKNKAANLAAKSSNLNKLVKSRISQASNKLQKLHDEYTNSLDYEKYKIYGDILLANIHKVKQGMESISLENFYDENSPIEIPLDNRLSPSKNAQKYFKKYNKYKNAKLQLHKQILIAKSEIEYLENVLVNLENSYEFTNIAAIKEELKKEGYLGNRFSQNKKQTNTKEIDKFNKMHMSFLTENGKNIIAGKNSSQNERVTFKKSRPGDFWFHAKNMPGSHVVLVNDGSLLEKDFMDAASIAAYYSKGRLSSNVPVDCTEIRNVKKIKGAGPGLVTYSGQNTLYVTPQEKEIQKMKSMD
ncbi:MAG: fibronectin/fibrinogen-binding protein [Clostridiales bacterium]|nr:MAG: fibronectin/fibrinogen-binding protein [Clostridiales bacterium]